jgi:ribosomal protein S18 acetylase RimI-like enzyme
VCTKLVKNFSDQDQKEKCGAACGQNDEIPIHARTDMPHIRLMTPQDISAVLRVQAECYSIGMNEGEQIIRARLVASPDTSWIVEDDADVLGYLVAYRSVLGKITPLGELFDIPAAPDALYLHDLAIGSRGAGRGLSTQLLQTAWNMALAEGLRHSALVSVQNSLAYWQKLGYGIFGELQAEQGDRLLSYEGPSYYLIKRL